MIRTEGTALPIISIRLDETTVRLLDAEAEREGITRSDVVRAALVSHRASNGARQRQLETFADELIARFGEDSLLTLRVTDAFDAEALIDGTPVDLYAIAVADVGDSIQLIVGDRQSDARARVGRVPVRAGAEAAIPLRLLAGLGIVDAADE